MKLGYDLDCTNAEGDSLHVEVKGTQTQGERVVLTENEVRHVREAAACGAAHALYVVSQINVARGSTMECSGGKATFITPWSIDDADLVPTEYSYNVLSASTRG